MIVRFENKLESHMPKVTSGENTVCPLEPQKSYLMSSYM